MKAHEIIFRTFSPPVYSLMARMTGSTVTADDLLQETFIEVIRSIDRFRGEASLATWIRKIAVSKCLMHLRSAWQNRATLFRDLGEDHLPYEPAVACDTPIDPGADGPGAGARQAVRHQPGRGDYCMTSRAIPIARSPQLMGKSVSFSKSQLARAHQRLRQAVALLRGGPRCGAEVRNDEDRLRHPKSPIAAVAAGHAAAGGCLETYPGESAAARAIRSYGQERGGRCVRGPRIVVLLTARGCTGCAGRDLRWSVWRHRGNSVTTCG